MILYRFVGMWIPWEGLPARAKNIGPGPQTLRIPHYLKEIYILKNMGFFYQQDL